MAICWPLGRVMVPVVVELKLIVAVPWLESALALPVEPVKVGPLTYS